MIDTPKPVREDWQTALQHAIRLLSEKNALLEATALTELLSRITIKPPKGPYRWLFVHNSGNGKTHETYHDETPQNDYRFAYRDTCIEVIPLYQAEPDPWKDVVTDACTVNHLDWDENDPRSTLAKLIMVSVQQALDPSISEAARKLQAGGKPGIDEVVATVAPTVAALDTGDATLFDVAPDPKGFEPPPIGSVWIHSSGREYTVIEHANTMSDNDRYPKIVVYRGPNNHIWARRLDDWQRSFRRKP